jgi:hypothetical protein
MGCELGDSTREDLEAVEKPDTNQRSGNSSG